MKPKEHRPSKDKDSQEWKIGCLVCIFILLLSGALAVSYEVGRQINDNDIKIHFSISHYWQSGTKVDRYGLFLSSSCSDPRSKASALQGIDLVFEDRIPVGVISMSDQTTCLQYIED